MLQSVRPIVFWVPMSILAGAVLISIWDIDLLLGLATAANDWILSNFGRLFNWGSFLFVVTVVAVYASPLGRVRIGGEGAEPLLSLWGWFSVTLCTTIAIGILFWATAEPIFHLNDPPPATGIAPASRAATQFSMTSLFMHWSFTPYAIYTVPSLAFALAYYNLKRSYSLSGPLSVLTGGRIGSVSAELIDALALFSLIAGIAATLGAGMLSISGGIATIIGVKSGPFLTGLVTIAIVGAFILSSITGLQRGIRFLSDINTKFFFFVLVFIFVTGPTLYMVEIGVEGLIGYGREFLPRSLGYGETYDKDWSDAWTVFNFANWLSWAPITALFLGRIGRGYTVRQFILVNFVAPSLFAIVWMSVFGGAAMHIDLSEAGVLNSALEARGPEAITYLVFERYPLASFLTVSFVLLSFVSYVTAADSNTEAIAGVCLRESPAHDPETIDSSPSSMPIKVTLGLFIGATAWVMTAFTGIDGVKMLSNLGGFPALFIVLAMNAVLILFATRLRARLTG